MRIAQGSEHLFRSLTLPFASFSGGSCLSPEDPVLSGQNCYDGATCLDKMKNGDEVGIDCGGSCGSVCEHDVLVEGS